MVQEKTEQMMAEKQIRNQGSGARARTTADKAQHNTCCLTSAVDKQTAAVGNPAARRLLMTCR